MKEYTPLGYNISLGREDRPFFSLPSPVYREITAPDEDGRSWRVKSADGSQSFRLQATGRTLASQPTSAEALKIALVLAIRDEAGRVLGNGGKLDPEDHRANVGVNHLAEAQRMADAPRA